MFLAEGYERTSVDAVARDSGVSKVTIYAYFPTKKALYAAAMKAGGPVERFTPLCSNLDPTKPRDSLTIVGQRFLKIHRDDAMLSKHRTICADAAGLPGVARAFYEEGPSKKMSELAAFLTTCHAVKALDVPDPDLAAEQFLCLFFGRAHVKAMLGLGKPSAAADARLVRTSVELFLRAYGSPQAVGSRSPART